MYIPLFLISFITLCLKFVSDIAYLCGKGTLNSNQPTNQPVR